MEYWEEEDWKMKEEERIIVNKLNISFEMSYRRKQMQRRSLIQSPNKFRYLENNLIKLNFDGASKGNPRHAGFGGIFRDSGKNTRWVYADWGGEMTNNEAELWAVYHGLRIAVHNGYMNLEIEGDSQITIEMLRKLNEGRSWEKVAKSWRTVAIIQEIGELLSRIKYKIFNHIRREGNRAADYLENWGSKETRRELDNSWRTIENS